MVLRSVPKTEAESKPTDVKAFDAERFMIVTKYEDKSGLCLQRDPEESIRNYHATVYELDPTKQAADREEDSTPDGALVATIEFSHLAFGEWSGLEKLFEFADAVSGDLLEIAEALFDKEGNTRESLDVAALEEDVLYIDMVKVEPGQDEFELVRYALEHIITRHGRGCFGAVYYQAASEGAGIAKPLEDRGFERLRRNKQIWFVDLGRRRPPLD